MVRNEEDMIASVIRHFLSEGVDCVLVADNVSTDRTRELLDALARSNPRVTVVDDPDPAYWQSEKMTSLAQRAAAEGATWIIPFDADELWVSPGRSLRDYFSSLGNVDVVLGDWYQHYAPLLPRRRDPFVSMRWRDDRPDTLSKVAFRYRPDIVIEMGNHDVTSTSPLRRAHDGSLEVHHYRFRSFGHMVRKVRDGREAIMLTDLDAGFCWHWRIHGSLSKARLAVVWIKMALQRRNRVRDTRLPNLT
jgi:hypothetical protein